jgi:alkylation response protein AidB-like acyl-CoA dehydrogenase
MTEALEVMSRSLLAELYRGRLRWDLAHPFPDRDADESRAGDEAVQAAAEFARARIDPAAVEESRALPDGLLTTLHRSRYLALRVPTELGGLGLSLFDASRVIEAIGSWSLTVGYLMAVHDGLGAAAYLPLLAPGELRDLVLRGIAEGRLFADADTEPTGAANNGRVTTATPVDGGRAYVLNGEKVFVATGGPAGLLTVSATLSEGCSDVVRVFFVESSCPGFRVRAIHDLVGLRGLPIAALALEGVRVPRERMLPADDGLWRLSPRLSAIWATGRLEVLGVAALTIGRLCVGWARDFIRRRAVDGRPLGGYEAIQRLVAMSVADVFAIESVLRWCFLGGVGLEHRYDMAVAKNITTCACWRVVERTMSLLAAEGAETAPSKARRGAVDWPLERAWRDARLLRIAGGVDFRVDIFLAATRMLPPYLDEAWSGPETAEPELDAGPLSPENRDHLAAVVEGARELAAGCRRLALRHPEPADLLARERPLILLHRAASELLTMTCVLARAAGGQGPSHARAQTLAGVWCAEARRRLAGIRAELERGGDPGWARTAEWWLAEDGDLDLPGSAGSGASGRSR